MIVRIVDKFDVEYGAFIYENNENGEVFVQDDFHCDAEVGEENRFDTIFGTNEEQVNIKIDPSIFIAKEIVQDIIACREGEMYGKITIRLCLRLNQQTKRSDSI